MLQTDARGGGGDGRGPGPGEAGREATEDI